MPRRPDLAFEIQFLEPLLRTDPKNTDVLAVLGHHYTKLGQHDKGLDVDRRLVVLKPRDPTARYNLACSLSLIGEVEEGLRELAQALELGFNNLELLLSDPDIQKLRGHPTFRELLGSPKRLPGTS
jgi:tetratricopeptide (TPR) repeat protein